MNKPYVGITGFMNRSQVETVLDSLEGMGFPDSHRLMVGVLVSPKSLRREPLKPVWRCQYPDPDELATIFVPDPKALNLVHYNTKEPSLADQLERVVGLTPGLDGFQLNIMWPDPAELRRFKEQHPDLQIVLQLGPRVLAANDSESASWLELRNRLKHYMGLVDYLLLDGSGGIGIEMDSEYLGGLIFDLTTLADIRCMQGVAGGLSAESLERLIWPVLQANPSLSWDAQGMLRTSDQLDIDKCREYLKESARLIGRMVQQHQQQWGKSPKYGF